MHDPVLAGRQHEKKRLVGFLPASLNRRDFIVGRAAISSLAATRSVAGDAQVRRIGVLTLQGGSPAIRLPEETLKQQGWTPQRVTGIG
jgi:hypothetical protein